MDYEIANIRIRLPETFVTGHLAAALAPFATPEKEDAELILHAGTCPEPEENYRQTDTFDFPDAHAVCYFGYGEAGYRLVISPHDETPVHFLLSKDTQEAITDFTPERNPALLRFGLWSLFNITAVQRLTIAVHASAVCCHEEAVLFLGESGTGKSTHTRLWREHIAGALLLNDDSPFVRITEQGARAYGSPWSGKTPCYRNANYPIRAFVRLSQGPQNIIRHLSPLEAIGALLPSCPPSFAHEEKLREAVYGLLSKLIPCVQVYHLSCLPDADAARLAHQTVFEL